MGFLVSKGKQYSIGDIDSSHVSNKDRRQAQQVQWLLWSKSVNNLIRILSVIEDNILLSID